MFGLFDGIPKEERIYRAKAQWLNTKLNAKKKRIGRLAEADIEFREKLIANPEAALLYAGIDFKGFSVMVRFLKKEGVGGYGSPIAKTILEISFPACQKITRKEQLKKLGHYTNMGTVPSFKIEISLPYDIELPEKSAGVSA